MVEQRHHCVRHLATDVIEIYIDTLWASFFQCPSPFRVLVIDSSVDSEFVRQVVVLFKAARAVGIAGSDEKNHYLTDELGIDAAINYKNPEWRRALKEACPKGIDVYFDNVGGEVSDAVMPLLNHGARIVLCGQISLYNLDKPDVGPRPQTSLLVNRALMKGFIITDYSARFAEGVMNLAQWLAAGKLKYAETIVEGFENTPQAFIGLFSGANLGKQIVKVACIFGGR